MSAKSRPILLIEDDRICEALVLRALKKSDFAGEIVVARDAGEAMTHLLPSGGSPSAPAPPRPCAVFLDLSLPGADGLELLRCIRSDYAIHSLPVVIFSSSLQDDDIRRAYAEGANSYVLKPVDADELAETVRNLAVYWSTLNYLPPRR
jgi:two-component system response regulator